MHHTVQGTSNKHKTPGIVLRGHAQPIKLKDLARLSNPGMHIWGAPAICAYDAAQAMRDRHAPDTLRAG